MTLTDNPSRAAAFMDGPFAGICTPAEFAAAHHLKDDSTIRHAIRSNRLIPGRDCIQLGKQWLLSPTAWLTWDGSYMQFSLTKVTCRKYIDAEENTLS